MIPASRDEISTGPAETDFTPRLHVEIKFGPGKTGQFSTCFLIILNIICMHFLWIFLFLFFFCFFCKHIILQNRRFIDFH